MPDTKLYTILDSFIVMLVLLYGVYSKSRQLLDTLALSHFLCRKCISHIIMTQCGINVDFDLTVCCLGFLESLDDFYLLGSSMVLLQTTNNVFNADLYNNVTFESLFAWQRVRLANTMATSGAEWADVFAQYNSGEKQVLDMSDKMWHI